MRIETGYLKLAQLYNLASTTNKKKYELVDQLEINYSVPDEFKDTKTMKKISSGYSPLHVSVMRFDLDLTLDLLRRGANVLKQGTLNGWTPVHLIFYNMYYKIEQQMIWEISGTLEQQKLLYVLLTAHVNTGNPFNPKSKQGISHLHIACICNHVESVQFLTNQNSVNQAAGPDSHWPGYTALHFAVKYSSSETVEILLKNKADVHAKDAHGMSPLQLMIDRLIDLTACQTFGKPLNCLHIDKEDISLHELELQLEVTKMKNIIVHTLRSQMVENVDYSESEGLVLFHAACVQNYTPSIFQDLAKDVGLNLSLASDSSFWPGWTPLHFAACCSLEAVKVLVDHGADLTAKNTKGETTLDFCLKKYAPVDIRDILSMDEGFKNILLTDGSTRLLDVIALMSDCDKFSDFLQTIADTNVCIPLDSPLWPGYSLLHLAVRMNEIRARIVGQDMDDSVFGICYCFEDFHSIKANEAVTFWKILDACLSKGCSLATKDANGLTPIHLAFYLRKTAVVAELIKLCKEDAVDPNGLSHLHVACALDRPSALAAVKEFHRRGSSINSPVKRAFQWHNELLSKTAKPRLLGVQANSTALHIAVAFQNQEVVEYLLSNGAKVHSRDALGQTPVHLSMSSSKSISRLLLNNAPNLTDSSSDEGLSYLHVAAFANDDLAIRKLLRNEASANVVFRISGDTPLHVAVKEDSDRAVRELLRAGGRIDSETLERALAKEDSTTAGLAEYFVVELKRRHCQVFPSGITSLHLACSRFDHRWARQLLETGADPNARVREDHRGPWRGYTPLHLLIHRARMNSEGLRCLLGMVELLLKHGADGTIEGRDGCTPIMMALDALPVGRGGSEISGVYWASAVDKLFEDIKKYDCNPVNSHGFSLFHLACIQNRENVVRQFVANGVDVNSTTDPLGKFKGYGPLHFALHASAGEVAILLIERGADVKAEDVRGRTPLHFAVTWTSMEDLQLVEMLLRSGADVNAKDLKDQTPMDCLLTSEHLTGQLLEFLRKNGSTMDTSRFLSAEGSIGLAMKNAFANDGRSIFQALVEVCDLRNAIGNGFDAIHSIVSVTTNGVISVSAYFDCIGQLMEMGCELDQQDEQGKTALHKAAHFHNAEAVKALLSLGADLNIADKNNTTPFNLVNSKMASDVNHRNSAKTVLAKRIWIMNLLGLHLNSDIQRYAIKIKSPPRGPSLKERFQEELVRLNSIRICESLYLGDFMSELKAVAAYPRMLAWKRGILDCYFSRGGEAEIREVFPLTAGILMMQFRKARARKGLLERSKVVMDSLWPFTLPDLCSEAILEYLNNYELKLLIDDTLSASIPRKRQRLQ